MNLRKINRSNSIKTNLKTVMVVYTLLIVSKSGGLIFSHDHSIPRIETEKTFSFPLDVKLDYDKKKVSVVFGQRDGIFGKLS